MLHFNEKKSRIADDAIDHLNKYGAVSFFHGFDTWTFTLIDHPLQDNTFMPSYDKTHNGKLVSIVGRSGASFKTRDEAFYNARAAIKDIFNGK